MLDLLYRFIIHLPSDVWYSNDVLLSFLASGNRLLQFLPFSFKIKTSAMLWRRKIVWRLSKDGFCFFLFFCAFFFLFFYFTIASNRILKCWRFLHALINSEIQAAGNYFIIGCLTHALNTSLGGILWIEKESNLQLPKRKMFTFFWYELSETFSQ